MEREKAAEYRLNAADCISFAERISDLQQKLILLVVAKAWLVLARFVEQNNLSDVDAFPRDDPPTKH